MQLRLERSLRHLCQVVAASALFAASPGQAATLSVQGTLVLSAGAANDSYTYVFVVGTPSTVNLQSYGYGGGLNAAGSSIAAGGFDAYFSVFSGTGSTATFLASSDDGNCPPGASSAGLCRDPSLSLSLGAGYYTLVVSSFANGSIAENFGSGTLADGFTGLGNYDTSRTSNFAFDISGVATSPGVPTNLVVTPGKGQASISFTAPLDNGGDNVTNYTATCTAPGQQTRFGNGPSPPLVVTGLTGGVVYSCVVTASNRAGTSVASTTALVTPAIRPDLTPILMLLLD